jgi:hypothetical protein
MSKDDEVKKLPVATDAPRLDGFEGHTDEVEGDERESSSNRVIQGTLVKFTNEAKWVSNGDEPPSDFELVVINIGRVVQKWQDGSPVETIVLAPGQKYPDVKKLNEAVPQSEWEEGPDGRPRGPWQAQHVVYLLNPKTMDRFSFPTGTTGGSIAVSDLVDRVKWMRRFRGQQVYPVVELSDTYMPTRYGGRQRPHFEIVKWVTFDGGGNALPAPDTPKLPNQGAKEVTAPSAKEVTKDEIPF